MVSPNESNVPLRLPKGWELSTSPKWASICEPSVNEGRER